MRTEDGLQPKSDVVRWDGFGVDTPLAESDGREILTREDMLLSWSTVGRRASRAVRRRAAPQRAAGERSTRRWPGEVGSVQDGGLQRRAWRTGAARRTARSLEDQARYQRAVEQ
jgi:hypothetical protein